MLLLRISLLLLLTCLAAKAQEQRMEVGGGVMCDTLDQVERFVALRSDGKAPDVALLTVNARPEMPAPSALASSSRFRSTPART